LRRGAPDTIDTTSQAALRSAARFPADLCSERTALFLPIPIDCPEAGFPCDARTGSPPAETDPLKPDRTTRPIIQGTTTMITTMTEPRRTRGKLAHTLFAGAAFTAIATGALAEDAKLNEVVFDAQSALLASITVRGDGSKWTTIVPGNTGFGARIKIDTKRPGYVERVGVWLGECNNPECGTFERVLFEAPASRDYDVDRSISVPAESLTNARTGATTYGTLILNRCNTKPYTEPHSFQLTIDATMSANTRKAVDADSMNGGEVGAGFNGGDVTRHDTFEITVKCLSTRSDDTVERKPDPKRTKPEVPDDIDLFLSTYQSTQSDPRGTTCKPLKVTTRIETGEAGLKNVKLWRQVNGGPITSETKAMDAEALGGGKYGDDWNKFEHFTKTTTVQYKAEMLDGTFAPSTQWKSITIHCNGNFATPPSNANPDGHIPPRGTPQAELPPVIVTPPPLCGTKAAKVRGSAPCIKTAPVPDKRQQWADQKRKQAAEEKRRDAKEAELRRREAALKNAELLRRQPMVQRPAGFGRFTGPGRPMMGRPMGIGLRYQF
jgi:hypothetical protein